MAPPRLPSGDGEQGTRLRIFTLGRFAIEVSGVPLRFGAKAQRKPLQLLKAVIALGGDGVPVVPITESLWPDSDGDQAYAVFTVTLNRLRKLIGKDLLALQDGRLSLDRSASWVDAHAFTRAIAAAGGALEGGRGAEAGPLLERALELYQGPFLDGEFEPAEILAERERLHGMFLRHLGQIGQYLLDDGQHAPATRLFQRGLEVDGLAEELYRGLMTCLKHQGRYAEALAVYNRCQAVFQSQLGIEPAQETEALRRAIAENSRRSRSEPPASPSPALSPALSLALSLALSPAPQTGPPQEAASAPIAAMQAPPAMAGEDGGAGMAEGERRTATVVCLDLVGYTRLTERLDPEVLEGIMSRVLAIAHVVIADHGGIVNQVVGDEVVALFGVPNAQEDDARRAVQAALALHEEIAQIGRRMPELPSESLRLHTGIATGLMLIRLAGGPVGSYSVTGNAVVIASRLERLAKAGEILLAPDTYREVAPFFQTEPVRAVIPAGMEAALVPYRVVRPSRVESRFEASRLRGLTPYVGRETEVALLREALDAASRGQGGLVTVSGEAGMGKSRLLHELRHGPGVDAFTVLQGSCRRQGRQIPYQPFLDLLRQGLRLHMHAPPEVLADRLARRVEAISPELLACVPHYLHLLSIQDPRHRLPATLQGEALRAELERALGAVITMNLQHRPMVLLMEDWHWCDEASDAMMHTLAGVIAEYPLLVVVTYRPEFAGHWEPLRNHRAIHLNALEDPQIERVIQAVTGARQVPAELVARIRQRTEGNPLFIEELCRALRERGVLTVHSGRAVLEGAAATLRLPDSVHSIIRSRLDRLAARTRTVLQSAATIGAEFSGVVLARVLPSAHNPTAELEQLRAQGLIQQVRVYPEAVYRFNHAIIHDVVYETLPLRTRRRLHEQVAQAIEALHADRCEEHYEALAHHYANSANRPKALDYLERAGDKASRVHSLMEARQHYRAAYEAARGLAEEPTGEDRSDPAGPRELRRRCCEIALKWGQVSFYFPSRDLIAALERALEDAPALNDGTLAARATFWVGMFSYALGDHQRALAQFERCLNMSTPVGPAVEALAINYMGRSYLYMGRFPQSLEALTRSIPLLERMGQMAEVLNSIFLTALIHGLTGAFENVPPLVKKAFDLAEQLQNPSVKALGNLCTGLCGLLQGDWEAAREALSDAARLARALGNPIVEGSALWGLGYTEGQLGDTQAGIRLMIEGIATIEATDSHLGVSAYYARLAEIYAREGQFRQAKAFANKALLVGRSGEKLGEDIAYCVLAVLAAKGARADWSQAEAYMEESLRISRATGARSRLAVSLLEHARLLTEQGETRRARLRLKEARGLFKAMGMHWWDRQAARLQTQLRA